MDGVDEIVAEFLAESAENLERLGRELVELEHDPAAAERLDGIFRIVHTLKGTSAFLGFNRLERLAHVGEHLLARLREGARPMTPEIADGLLALADAASGLLATVERTGAEGDDDTGRDAVLIAALLQLADPSDRPKRVGQLLVEAGLVSSGEVSLAVHEQEMGDPRMLGEILAEHGVATENQVDAIVRAHHAVTGTVAAPEPASTGTAAPPVADPVPAAPPAGVAAADPASGDTPPPPPDEHAGASLAATTIRVDVRLLDEMIRLVGELVLARNQIVEHTSGARGPLATAAQRLDLITAELQAQVMTTRMQPIGSAWRRFPRLLRDLSAQCGKLVRLELDGADTELDRSLIEAVTDPLAHLVRNAVAHGIETPAERLAAGKPAEGTLSLRAYHADGQVHIEIHDDGCGIDPERLRRQAVQSGLLTPEQARRLSDHEALALIFVPGFSTAGEVTPISGRGVGMDVAKTNVEKISGVLDVQSRVGAGTTVKIKIPLTLAIIPALIVSCHDDRYAVPQNSVVELVPVRRDPQGPAVELLHDVPVYRLRGALLPLVYLRRQFGLPPAPDGAPATIVVLAVRGRSFGLVVDGVHNAEEIVVKPLARQLKAVPVYAGATIMGDGQVALILDVVGIAQRGRVITDLRVVEPADPPPARRPAPPPTTTVVLVEGHGGERRAIPLSSVVRLEHLDRGRFEAATGGPVVQYDGAVLPVVGLGELIGGAPDPATTTSVPTVVCHHDGRAVGITVRRIVDIVELPAGAGDPLVGTPLVAAGRVTEVIDVGAAAIGRLAPAEGARPLPAPVAAGRHGGAA